MKKLNCSMAIEEEPERKAMLAWVKTVANGGYSEIENMLSFTYLGDPAHDDGKYWGIIHTVSHYKEHSIESKNI